MFWTVPGMGGVVMGFFRGEYHLFTTKTPAGQESRTIHHAVSKDFLAWSDLPDALAPGAPGAFDGYTLYDLQVVEHNGRYYMFYTGLDRPLSPGQRQAIGLAVSDDLITWTRHPRNPVLTADPRWYEQAVPDEAAQQPKNAGRLWFRDPWVVRDPASGRFGMAVTARANNVPAGLRGCLAWATSKDLVHWTPEPPLYLPERFHTMECPVLFEHGGIHYLIFLTHPYWGTAYQTSDPYQRSGSFYACSRSGIKGPYEIPEDEIIVGGAWTRPEGREFMRAPVLRTVAGPEGLYAHYHLYVHPGQDDNAMGSSYAAMANFNCVMPLPKPLRFAANGRMALGYSPLFDRLTRPVELNLASVVCPAGWEKDGNRFTCKNYSGRSVLLFDVPFENGVYGANIRLVRGSRAGLVARAAAENGPGWQIVLDPKEECLTFGALDAAQAIDRRRWRSRAGWVELRVAVFGPSVEIYCDGELMLHQVRYRENSGKVGLLVEQAEAQFEGVTLRLAKEPVPMPHVGGNG